MITIDLTPITSRLDTIIELLHHIITPTNIQPQEITIEEPKKEPIEELIKDDVIIDEPIKEEPKQPPTDENPIISFENEEEEKPPPPDEEYQCPKGWTTCIFNPEFEIEIKNQHFIRHKQTKELMQVKFDEQLYPYPYFEKAIFEKPPSSPDKPFFPKHLAHIVAENFLPNPKKRKFLNYKDGNNYNWKVSNLEWTTKPFSRNKIDSDIPIEIINSPTFANITLDGETFINHPVFKYNKQFYQLIYTTKGNYYIECPKNNSDFLLINDNNEIVGYSQEEDDDQANFEDDLEDLYLH
jgi:hypothetical protein